MTAALAGSLSRDPSCMHDDAVRMLVESLTRRGVRLSTRDGHLVIDAPKGELTAADRDQLRAHKVALLEILAPRPPSRSKPTADPADPLYQLIRDHRDPADRPVMTPDGPGLLWQVLGGRVGVVLPSTPKEVAFYSPDHVHVPVHHHHSLGDCTL